MSFVFSEEELIWLDNNKNKKIGVCFELFDKELHLVLVQNNIYIQLLSSEGKSVYGHFFPVEIGLLQKDKELILDDIYSLIQFDKQKLSDFFTSAEDIIHKYIKDKAK